MAFKMKGKPMHMGTTAYKSALKKETVMVDGKKEERSGGERSPSPSSGKPDWSTAPKNNTQARIDWYKKHNLKLDSTTTLKTDTKDSQSLKEANKPKNTSKGETKKVDASGGSKLDKIARGEKPEGTTGGRKLDYRKAEDRKKMTHKEIFKQKQAERRAKRTSKRAKGKTLRAAIDKWRAGGRKGPMPTRSTI